RDFPQGLAGLRGTSSLDRRPAVAHRRLLGIDNLDAEIGQFGGRDLLGGQRRLVGPAHLRANVYCYNLPAVLAQRTKSRQVIADAWVGGLRQGLRERQALKKLIGTDI